MEKAKSTLTRSRWLAIYLLLVTLMLLSGILYLWPNNIYCVQPDQEPDSTQTVSGPDSIRSATDDAGPAISSLPEDSGIPGSVVSEPDSTKVSGENDNGSAKKPMNETRLIWLILLIGALGSSLHGLISISNYVGNDSFDAKWSLWYALRPLVGAVLSLLFYLIIRAGFIKNFDTSKNFYMTVALSGLIGMFSKQALNKLSDIFDTIFQSDKDKELKNKMDSDAD